MKISIFVSDEPITIIEPAVIKPESGKLEHILQITAPELGRNFSINLVQNPHIVSKDLVLLETFTNGSWPLVIHDENHQCYFRGNKAAVSLCNGVVSFSFTIKPISVKKT